VSSRNLRTLPLSPALRRGEGVGAPYLLLASVAAPRPVAPPHRSGEGERRGEERSRERRGPGEGGGRHPAVRTEGGDDKGMRGGCGGAGERGAVGSERGRREVGGCAREGGGREAIVVWGRVKYPRV
jgi:hypothetical protein